MTMYDMTRVNANGYFDSENTEEARYEKRKVLNEQRTKDYKEGSYALAGGIEIEKTIYNLPYDDVCRRKN